MRRRAVAVGISQRFTAECSCKAWEAHAEEDHGVKFGTCHLPRHGRGCLGGGDAPKEAR